jgi:RNA polymerase sigma factor (sigma-70 family)
MSVSPVDSLDPLVAAAADGDRAAFATLVSETSGVVSSIALAIVRDIDVSRDVAQDVFLAAWRDLRKLRNPSSFLPWLRQITRNRAHHVLRTHVRSKRRLSMDDADAVLEGVADPRPDASARLIASEDRAALAEALAALPDETREVLTLYYREGRSTAQVAVLLDLDDAAVRKRLSRAREALRADLLRRASSAIEQTRPGGAFTAAVMTALPIAGNAAGSATAIAVANAIKTGLLAKALMAIAGVCAGAAGGIAGVLFGSTKLLREVRDEEERRGLYRFTAVSIAVVIVFAVMFPVSRTLTASPIAPVMDFAAFIAALAVLQHVWLPRIIARRLAAEMIEDAERARRRRRAERRAAIIGWTLGLTFGTAGLLLGIYFSAHH